MKSTKRFPVFLIGGAAGLLAGLSFALGFFTGPEAFLEDRLSTPVGVRSEVVIVAIDNESLAKIGQWPWPRAVFAKIFDQLSLAKPKVVALDVILADRSRLGEADDETLTQAIRRAEFPLIFPVEGSELSLSEQVRAESVTKPLFEFTVASNVSLGHVNLVIDRDNVVRSFPPRINAGEAIYSSLALAAAEKAGYAVPADSLSRTTRIVYGGPPGTVRRIPFYRVLAGEDLPALKDKIIFIGSTAPDLHDEKSTPLSAGTAMPGAEIQANITGMLLSGARLTPISKALNDSIFVFLALLVAGFFVYFTSSFKALWASLVLGVLANLFLFISFERGWVGNIFHSNLAWLLSAGSLFSYRYLVTERNRRHMRELFGKYVSPAVLETILKEPEKVSLGGEEREVTVLFSDIRGFTTLSEKTTPPELVSILNRYFTLMTGEVLSHGGVLDKYIGDAVMAFWGAPLSDDRQADNALAASLGMLERLKEFNRELKREKGIEIDIGIGLYTGLAVVGNIGSSQRFDYTVMGDTVNVASRLEGLNKEHKTHLIIGQSTKEKITAPIQYRKIGAVPVKGRVEPITIYTVEGV